MITVSGKVVHGKGIGHLYGMPTANIDCRIDGVKEGVYGGIAHHKDKAYLCVVNIGTRPTADNETRKTVEAFLLDFNGNLYDENLSVDLMFYIRETKKFSSMDEVREQVDRDILKTRSVLAK